MAKTGLNYYTVDTDRYQDRRIKRLKKDLGCSGVAVYDYLLCEVYRVHGCFIEWDENTAFDVADYFGIKESKVAEIVRYCGAVGLFDKELLTRGIITSSSIQRRYLEMCNRAKRANVEIPEELRIFREEMAKLPEELPKTPEESAQSKVKESKLNKNSLSLSPSHEVESGGEQATGEPSQREKDLFFEILFFRNIKEPEKEVQRFIDHYSAIGWRRSNGAKITDRRALCRQWRPQDDKPRFPKAFLDALAICYDRKVHEGVLHDIIGIEIDGERLRLILKTRETMQFIEECKLQLFPIVTAVGCTKLSYRIPKQ